MSVPSPDLHRRGFTAPGFQRQGFRLPGNAAAAARKGHELGLLRQWTPEEARRMGEAAARARHAKQEAAHAGAAL